MSVTTRISVLEPVPQRRVSRPRSPVIAVLLSFLLPGLGHLYVGCLQRGAVAFAFVLTGTIAGALCAVGLLPRLWLWAASALILSCALLFAWIDPPRQARRVQYFEPQRYHRWYVYAGALVLGPVVLQAPIVLAAMAMHAGYSGLYRVVSGSMEPALKPEEVILVDSTYYTRHRPRRGDAVIFRLSNQPVNHVKRIAALEGDRIAIRDGRAIVNGEAVNEPYAQPGNPQAFFNTMPETVVQAGHVFVLGDNRANSIDSRSEQRHGPVALPNLRGRVTQILLAPDVSRIGRWTGAPR